MEQGTNSRGIPWIQTLSSYTRCSIGRRLSNFTTINVGSAKLISFVEMIKERANVISIAGIGTWAQNQPLSVTSTGGFFKRIKADITATVDQAVGSSFRSHMIAGYQFIMRYFSDGDDIYISGFPRGAYTARSLAEMVQTIGLLSQGNEEMILFAWSTFSEYQQSRGRDPQISKRPSPCAVYE